VIQQNFINFIEFLLLFGSHVDIDCMIDYSVTSNNLIQVGNGRDNPIAHKTNRLTDKASQRNKNGTKKGGSPEKTAKNEEGCQPSFIFVKISFKIKSIDLSSLTISL